MLCHVILCYVMLCYVIIKLKKVDEFLPRIQNPSCFRSSSDLTRVFGSKRLKTVNVGVININFRTNTVMTPVMVHNGLKT